MVLELAAGCRLVLCMIGSVYAKPNFAQPIVDLNSNQTWTTPSLTQRYDLRPAWQKKWNGSVGRPFLLWKRPSFGFETEGKGRFVWGNGTEPLHPNRP